MFLARIVFLLFFHVFFDFLYGILGLLVIWLFPASRYPRIHKFGCRLLAMSTFLVNRFLPSRCKQDCSTSNCGNWTCPNYSKYAKPKKIWFGWKK